MSLIVVRRVAGVVVVGAALSVGLSGCASLGLPQPGETPAPASVSAAPSQRDALISEIDDGRATVAGDLTDAANARAHGAEMALAMAEDSPVRANIQTLLDPMGDQEQVLVKALETLKSIRRALAGGAAASDDLRRQVNEARSQAAHAAEVHKALRARLDRLTGEAG